jgi:hypothetical protein
VGKTQIGNPESNGPTSMKSNLRLKFQIWAPALFSGFLCFLLQHFDDGKLAAMNPGFPAFISFLPMAFLFVGFSTHSFVNRTEKRLDDLERKIDAKP